MTVSIPSRADIPLIGFGAGTKWQWKKKAEVDNFAINTDPDLVASLKLALQAGFTHLDTAEVYSTRSDIGQAVKEAIQEKTVASREDIFITDKYCANGGDKNPSIQPKLSDGTIRGPYESLKAALDITQLGYIDLFLFHTTHVNPELTIEQQWSELVRLKEEGLVKKIGVSNYDVENLEKIKSLGKGAPEVLQIEFHPYLQNQSTGIRKYAEENNIILEAYAPLAPLTKGRAYWNELVAKGEKPEGSKPPLDDLLSKLEDKYGRSETQILLRYTLQNGFIPITTSSKRERIDDILKIFEWELEDEDVQRINEAGNSWFYRAFKIPPNPKYDEALKEERGLI